MALVLGATATAYQYSLRSLLGVWRTPTPLAYIGVFPVAALTLLWMCRHPHPHERQIHDRQIDYLLGLPLILGALSILHLSRSHSALFFWARRLDLLSLPLFVSGLLAVLLGTRAIWRARTSIGILVLAWPPLARVLLGDPVSWLTAGTARLIGGIASHIGMTVSSTGGREVVLRTSHGHSLLLRSDAGIAAAVIAFLVIGLAFCAAWPIERRRKVLWLLAGAGAVWVTETARIIGAALIGHTPGQDPSWVLDPWEAATVLAVTLLIAIAVAALISPPLRARGSQPGPGAISAPARHGDRLTVAFAVVLLSVIAMAGEATALPPLGALVGPLGDPLLLPLSAYTPPGTASLARGTPLFLPAGAHWLQLQAGPDVVDLIGSTSTAGLGRRQLIKWFPIGSAVIGHSVTVGLGRGVVASLESFRRPDGRSWLGLTWVWPVIGSHGDEQVVVIPSAEAVAPGPAAGQGGWAVPVDTAGAITRLEATGRGLVADAASHPHPTLAGSRPLVEIR